MKSLMWDYNIPPEHCLEVLEGKRKMAGHYNESTLFRKLIESFPWFTVLGILNIRRIKLLLSQQLINSLRFKSLSETYGFIRNRLQETL
jgi:hypothetical protein